MKTQGKCTKCKLAFHWKGSPLLRNAICPYCGEKLKATTHQIFKRFTIGRKHPVTHEGKDDFVLHCHCDFCNQHRGRE